MKMIISQRYTNRVMNRVETIEEVSGSKVVTDYQSVDIGYFKNNYELVKDK